jgi:GH15 family glucan-1,4-alpha-glucosidase
MVGFVDANDPRMVATVEAIEEDLSEDGLVRRYRTTHTADGLTGTEGFFLMPSFWLVDVLAMQGHRDRAEAKFHKLLALANDVGLFSEEYDPLHRELLGNFPQAFTHMALINSAELLTHARRGFDCTRTLAERARPSEVTRSTSHHRCPTKDAG